MRMNATLWDQIWVKHEPDKSILSALPTSRTGSCPWRPTLPALLPCVCAVSPDGTATHPFQLQKSCGFWLSKPIHKLWTGRVRTRSARNTYHTRSRTRSFSVELFWLNRRSVKSGARVRLKPAGTGHKTQVAFL